MVVKMSDAAFFPSLAFSAFFSRKSHRRFGVSEVWNQSL